MQRYLAITIITSLGVLGIWRGWAGKSRAAAADHPAENATMSAAELRYFNSQAAHWRQCLLKRTDR
jgi:hypothetical protein